MTRAEQYKQAVGDDTVYEDLEPDPAELEQFLLIEESRFDGEVCVTTWNTPAEAADYHDGQEYPEDWPIKKLIDLDTGNELRPVTVTEWRAG